MRIISTVPSQTELLADLGLDNEVVGITKFCVHPENWYKFKTRIGGTKTLDLKKIISLKPDLIIANKEENVKEQIQELGRHCKTHVSEIKTVEDNISLIKELGELTGKRMTALRLATELQEAIASLLPIRPTTAAYLIWKDPYMTVGGDTYIHNVMHTCGLQNVFADAQRYPQTSIPQLMALKPEVLLLSSEPYPFKEKHLIQLQRKLPATQVLLTDGEVFSWYGTRMIKKFSELNELMRNIQARV